MKINAQFKNHPIRYLLQCLVAGIIIFIIMRMLDIVAESMLLKVIGITSLGATTFIIFGAPRSRVAHGKALIPAYFIATLVGVMCYYLAISLRHNILYMHQVSHFEIAAGLSLGLTMLITVLLESPHPPAAGFSVAIVMHVWELNSLVVILGAVLCLGLFQILFETWLIDLY